MWPKSYRDYKKDESLIKYPVEPGSGIIGCEMHEINGWGNDLHKPKKPKNKGLIQSFLDALFGFFK